MDDDPIGTITGTATYDEVVLRSDGERVHAEGRYHDDTTTYSAPADAVYIGGLRVGEIDGEVRIKPGDDDVVWVEATETELLLKESK